MTSVLLLTPACARHADVVEPRRVRLRDRLEAHVRTHHLDRRLADGVPPERSAALSLRARRLVDPAYGRTLAGRLHAIVQEAIVRRVPRAQIAVRLAAVAELTAEFDELARRLLGPRPPAVRGVAQVSVLLGDGGGPLYSTWAGEDLGAAVRRARAALEIV
ncbi:MAG: hypothetical protein QOH72_2377 [Solirubrobacteraceae bacterium]|jgi:hypothetical protein|nr:hypothetical protein [Solirubrobacteraceae bacterium]